MVDSRRTSRCRFPGPANQNGRSLLFLILVYGVFWIGLAINPVNRFDWFLENLLVFAAWIAIVLVYQRALLSPVAGLLVTIFLLLHAYGAHYSYSLAPFGAWLSDAFGWERNHFDRLVHFAFGLLLTRPLAELLKRTIFAGSWVCASYFAVALILAFSSLYELIEWTAAMVLDAEDALAFLGTQGDIFDAQKDAGLAFLGSLLAFAFGVWFPPRS